MKAMLEKTTNTVNKYIRVHQNRLTILLIFCIALVGVAEIILATPFGPGVGSDAVVYLTSARNFLTGHGLGLLEPDGSFRLLPYFPPFYPLALSIIGIFVRDLVEGARWMNAILFGGLILIVGYGFYRYTHSSFFAVVLSCALAFSSVLIDVSTWAMSEPISLVVGFSGLLFTLMYLERSHWWHFLISALLVGLAFLSRFAAVAYCLAGALIIFLFVRERIGKRFGISVLYVLISFIPMLIWFIIDFSMTGTLGSRSSQNLSNVPARANDLILPLKTAFYEWTPYVIQASRWIRQPFFRIILICIGLLIAGAVFGAIRSLRQKDRKGYVNEAGIPMVVTTSIFGLFYILMIVVTYIFTFPPITLSNRMFSPLIVVYLLLIAWLGFIIVRGFRSWIWLKGLVIVGMLLFVINYGIAAKSEITALKSDGLGYNAWVYRKSTLIAYVKTLPVSTPLISNKAPMLLYYTGRAAYTIQEIYNPSVTMDFKPFGADQNDKAQRVFREDGGALVLFNSIADDFIGLYGEEKGNARYKIFIQGLNSVYQASDGQVYYYR